MRSLFASALGTSLRKHKAGLFWLVGYLAAVLLVARSIFWSYSWDFAWFPSGLATLFLLFFLAVHLCVGPLVVFFCASLKELGTYRSNGYCKPPLQLFRQVMGGYCSYKYLTFGALAYAIVFIALVGYTNVKPAIPLLNDARYDSMLYRLDQTFFSFISLGDSITVPKHQLVTAFLDAIYFQMWTLACITLVVAFRNPSSFWRVTASWCLAFGCSLPLSILVPSLGPAFYKPELFSHIAGTYSAQVMDGLWNHYQAFQRAPLATPIVKANGIVAMPSLHIALVYLSVVVLGEHLPVLRKFLWSFLALFIVATVYLGWHYLSDGIVGLLLGFLAYRISCRWFPETERSESLCGQATEHA